MEAKRRRVDAGGQPSATPSTFDVRAWLRGRHADSRLVVGERVSCFRKTAAGIEIRSPDEARPPPLGEPPLGADLNEGLQATEARIDEKRRRRECLPDPAAENPVDPVVEAVREPGDVVTYRNNLNKIGFTPYNQRDPWQLDAAIVDGVLYLDIRDPYPDNCPPILQHYGYRLEELLTGRAPDEEFCSVTSIRIGAAKGESVCLHVAAEIDAHYEEEGFVEIKCAIRPGKDHQWRTYNNVKLCKFWLQSALVNVPWVLVCFRSQAGTVEDATWLRTSDIPGMAYQSGAHWSAGQMLKFIEDVLSWLGSVCSEGAQVRVTYDPKAQSIQAVHVEGDLADRITAARERGRLAAE